jgi:hypothetical protein
MVSEAASTPFAWEELPFAFGCATSTRLRFEAGPSSSVAESFEYTKLAMLLNRVMRAGESVPRSHQQLHFWDTSFLEGQKSAPNHGIRTGCSLDVGQKVRSTSKDEVQRLRVEVCRHGWREDSNKDYSKISTLLS